MKENTVLTKENTVLPKVNLVLDTYSSRLDTLQQKSNLQGACGIDAHFWNKYKPS